MTPLLLLEINEVPWRLLDKYLGDEGFPNLRAFFDNSVAYTSLATDVGDLSPWITWPTFHRGMNNVQHGIRNLGQDPETFGGVALWDEIRHRGGAIGVCGSMQSWPPRDPGPDGFYLPDTFAHDSTCIPSYVEPFQAFNLGQVRRNARVVDSGLPKAMEMLRVGRSALKSGVRIHTLIRVAAQIAMERVHPGRAKRRPIFQAILFWDVFRQLYRKGRAPALATFFTNHVAGVMHRYWHDVFPEDFAELPAVGAPKASGQEPLMRFALTVLDDILGEVISWSKENPELVVVFASSMGQQAVRYESHEGVEFVVASLPDLMRAAGALPEEYLPLLAMVPQVAVDVPNAKRRSEIRDALRAFTTMDGHPFVTVHELGSSLSITVLTPRRTSIDLGAALIRGEAVAWESLGVRVQEVEAGTAYHIPEGSLAFFGQRVSGCGVSAMRPFVRADEVKEWLLRISERGVSEILRPPKAPLST